MPDRVCVLASGGLHSAVLLAVLARRYEVHLVYVRCGLTWERAEEIAFARAGVRDPTAYASVRRSA